MVCDFAYGEEAFADLGEAGFFVEAESSVVFAVDAEEEAFVALFLCGLDGLVHERFTDAGAVEAMEEVDAAELVVRRSEVGEGEVGGGAEDVADGGVAGRELGEEGAVFGGAKEVGVGGFGVVFLDVTKDVGGFKEVCVGLEEGGAAEEGEEGLVAGVGLTEMEVGHGVSG